MKPILLLSLLFLLSSCDQAQEKRRYQEVVVKSESAHPFLDMMAAQGQDDPHAFMQNLSEGEDPHAFMKDMPSTASMKDMPINDALMASVMPAALSWKTPEAWQEKPGSGMRVATFFIEGGSNKAECSVISLGAQAGSLEANVKRWADQINVSLEDGKIAEFIDTQSSFKTQDNISAKIIDFTPLQEKEDGQAPSMMAAILNYPDKTIFVKLMGPKDLVAANREKFKAFCQSLKSNDS